MYANISRNAHLQFTNGKTADIAPTVNEEVILEAEKAVITQAIVVVIPAYNEAQNIEFVVRQSLYYADKIIVIDDGSTDNTAAVAEAAGAIVIRHPYNQGKGVALTTGFEAASQFKPKQVVTIDGDGQHNPHEIMTLIEPILSARADIVIGSRYLSLSNRVPFLRICGHRIFNFITNQFSGISVSDSQSGFRAFSPRAISVISFDSKGFSVESEMQFLADDYKLKVVEVPINILYEDPPKRNVIWHGLLVLNGMKQMVWYHRPFTILGVLGVMLQLTSVLLLTVVDVDNLLQLTLFMMLFISGMLIFMSGVMLQVIRNYFLKFWRQRR